MNSFEKKYRDLPKRPIETVAEPETWPETLDDFTGEKPFELPAGNAEEAIALLRLWREDKSDDDDQRETWDYLKRVLDEDRLSDRKLFQ